MAKAAHHTLIATKPRERATIDPSRIDRPIARLETLSRCASTTTPGRPSRRSPAARSTPRRSSSRPPTATGSQAYLARAAEPSGAGIVIFPDVRGLHAYYEDLALRFAENGIDAIAIDYFGRTAGIGDRGPGFPYQEHVPLLSFDGLRADANAAIDHIRAETGVERLFTVGFCMGGRALVPRRDVRQGPGRRHRLLRLAGGRAPHQHAGPGRPRGELREPGARDLRRRRTRRSPSRR